MSKLSIGMCVRVCEGSGYLSGKVGVIISPSDVKKDGRGIPNIPGHYQPVDYKEQVAIKFEHGIDTMYKNRCIPV
jgi:hypothetical protein